MSGGVCRIAIKKHGRRPFCLQTVAREADVSAPHAFSVPSEGMTVSSYAEIAATISLDPRLKMPSRSAAVWSSNFEGLLPLFT